MRITKYFFLLLSFILFVSCSDDSTSPNSNAERDRQYIEKINHFADSLTTSIKSINYPDHDFFIPGLVFSVWSEEKDFSYTLAKGKADLALGRLMDEDDLFRIGSITKTFVITVLLQLVDEKKLFLDDKLSKFYPDFPNSDKVTIRMMCNMSSGIYNYFATQYFNEIITLNPVTVFSPQDLVNLAKDSAFYFNPGTGFEYSNTNTILLGMIIENLTGNKLDQEVKSRIIDELNLENTFFPIDRFFPSGYSFSKGYCVESLENYKEECSERFDPSLAWAAGAMISNVHDLKIWLKALAEGTLISSEMQSQRLITVNNCFTGIPLFDKVKYGLGIMNYKGFLGHGGDIMGYHTFAMYDPLRKAGVIALMNYNSQNLQLSNELLKILYPELTD